LASLFFCWENGFFDDLNVGGCAFATNKQTLIQKEGTYFSALLCNGGWVPDADGTYFIDRDPDNFTLILRSLRYGEPIDLHGLSEQQAKLLQEDIQYYQIDIESCPRPVKSIVWDASNLPTGLAVPPDGRTLIRWGGAGEQCFCALASAQQASKLKIHLTYVNCGISIGYYRAIPSMVGDACTTMLIFTDGFVEHWPTEIDRRIQSSRRQGHIVTVVHDQEAKTILFEVNDCRIGEQINYVDHAPKALILYVGFFPNGRPGAVNLLDFERLNHKQMCSE